MDTTRPLGPADRGRLEAFLAPRLTSSLFLAANLRKAGLVDEGERFHSTYFGAFEGDDLVGVAGHCWNGNLMLQAPPARVPGLIEAVLASGVRDVKGVLAPGEQVAAALPALGDPATRLDSIEGLYQLALADLAVPSRLAAGEYVFRDATPADLDRLVPWRHAYEAEALGYPLEDADPAATRTHLAQTIAGGDLFVLAAGGEILATSAFNARLPEVVQIGGVYTPPAGRGRGAARAVVAGSLLAARDAGTGAAVLFTPDTNTSAIKAYESLGFRRFGDYRVTLFR